MTPYNAKLLEGGKIQLLLGGIGAVASGGLLTLGNSGAPFFMASFIVLISAYVFWNGVDQYVALQVQLKERYRSWITNKFVLIPYAMNQQTKMIIWLCISILTLFFGFVAEKSTLRLPVSIEMGFCFSFLVGFLSAADAVRGIYRRRAVLLRIIKMQHSRDVWVSSKGRSPGAGSKS